MPESYYDKIDSTGFRAALEAQIETRGQTVHDLNSRGMGHVLEDYIVGTAEELASMLFSCLKCLSVSELENLTKQSPDIV